MARGEKVIWSVLLAGALILSIASCKGGDPLDKYLDQDKAVIPPSGTLVKIMQYNIYGARGLYIDKEFDALAEVIHAQDPDFISINEVDSATNRSKGTIHTAELCKRLTALSGGKNQWRWNYAVAFQFGTSGLTVVWEPTEMLF